MIRRSTTNTMFSGAVQYALKFIKLLLAVCVFLLMGVFSVLCYLAFWPVGRCISWLLYYFFEMTLVKSEDIFFSIEHNTTLGICHSVHVVDGIITRAYIMDMMMKTIMYRDEETGKADYVKFCSYLEEKAGYLFWRQSADFNADDHFLEYKGKPPTNEHQLKLLVTEIANKPLDVKKPPWVIHIIPMSGQLDMIDNAGMSMQKTCIFFRISHKICDGKSSFRLLFESLSDDPSEFDSIRHHNFKKVARPENSKQAMWWMAFLNVICSSLAHWRKLYGKGINPLHGPKLTGQLIFDWSAPISLPLIKDIKNAMQCTINDVIASCVAGAFSRYLVATNDTKPPESMTVMIPINLHNPDERCRINNLITFGLPNLPIGAMDPLLRLRKTCSILDKMKGSGEPIVNRLIMAYTGNVMPYKLTKWMFGCHNPIVAIFSNIPGSTKAWSMHGQKVLLGMGVPPISSNTGISLLVSSYVNYIRITLLVDKVLIKDRIGTQLFLQCFNDELKDLSEAALDNCISIHPDSRQ